MPKVPGSHGSGVMAPCAQWDPSSQAKQIVLPLAFMNLPASQSVHVPWPGSGCTVPGLHCLGLRDPVLQKEPSGQAVHCSRLPSPTKLLNEPSSHGNGAEAPAAQKEPAVQLRHAVAPAPGWYLPGAQAAHARAPALH